MNRVIRFLLVVILFSLVSTSFSQNKYWVFFSDKDGASFNPYEYFDAKAIERRLKNNIPLDDISDYPINSSYKKHVSEIVNDITSETRWFNAVAVNATEDQIGMVLSLSCVRDVKQIYMQTIPVSFNEFDRDLSEDDLDLLIKQTERMNGSAFEKAGIDGKGIRVAIFDGGFPTVDTSPVFEHIRKDGRIIKTYDFAKKNEFVYDYMSHGTNVMSCIGGIIDGNKVGLATGAEFLLARTEIAREPFSEEENWLAAAEWADKNGADIINSSLGYTFHRYFNSDMDGKTSLVVKAANMAASKGILVVNAMGNDGTNEWKYVGTPADADSVLSIGGIEPGNEYHTSFSSYGPTADKRMKPNVVAYGHVIAAGKKGMHKTQGTSFSSPLVAGFAACALQSDRELTNMDLFKEIEKSGDLYPYFDYAHGFGVPQADYFTDKSKKEVEPTFDFVVDDDFLVIKVSDKALNANKQINDYFVEKNYLYYHIENEKGFLDKYALIDVYQKEALTISLKGLSNETIRVHYKGYTGSYKINIKR